MSGVTRCSRRADEDRRRCKTDGGERALYPSLMVGLSVTAFGVGLAAGNLAIGRLTAWTGRSETVLIFAIALIFVTQSAFLATDPSLGLAIGLLALWGFASGLAASANTAIQASRAGSDAGFVLASSESMNNGALLAPIVANWVGGGDTIMRPFCSAVCTLAALGVNLIDRQYRPTSHARRIRGSALPLPGSLPHLATAPSGTDPQSRVSARAFAGSFRSALRLSPSPRPARYRAMAA